MTTASTVRLLNKALSSGGVTEDQIAKFLNRKLERSKVKVKAKTTRVRRPRENTDYEDGRSNKHAILLAVNAFGEDGGQSASLQQKLAEIGHKMNVAVFQTTRSIMQNNEKLLKSTGATRKKSFKLTATGKRVLEAFEETFKATQGASESQTATSE